MKAVIGTFLFALIFSCLVNSIGPQQAPYPWPVGISGVGESAFGVKRDEGNIGEVNYTDGNRQNKFMSKIDEKSDERNVEFPLGAAN